MASPHSSQSRRPGPDGSWLRARWMASFTVASIWSWTAPSPAQPVAMRFPPAWAGDSTRARLPTHPERGHADPAHLRPEDEAGPKRGTNEDGPHGAAPVPAFAPG